MYKTKITETTEKYDKDGKLIEKIVREETTEENNDPLTGSNIPYKTWHTSMPLDTAYIKYPTK